MRILFIDNYDSFTYNVLEILRSFDDVEVCIVKNDELSGVNITDYDKMIISPGPDLPKAANELTRFISTNLEKIPTLGICLGHQAIAEFYGGNLKQYKNPKHGEKTKLSIESEGVLFGGLPRQFEVGLYHSWYVCRDRVPDELYVSASNDEGIIMAMQHKTLPIYTVQFHPESYMSAHGGQILHNFICS